MMTQKRPINLNLCTIKFPPMAIASILHRIAGVILFFLMPAVLYFFHLSLKNPASFLSLQDALHRPWYKLILFGFSAALVYHVLAGIRHLIMDLGIGETPCAGRYSAWAVIFLSAICILFLGIWLW